MNTLSDNEDDGSKSVSLLSDEEDEAHVTEDADTIFIQVEQALAYSAFVHGMPGNASSTLIRQSRASDDRDWENVFMAGTKGRKKSEGIRIKSSVISLDLSIISFAHD